jgi:hypothetical protein
MPQLKTLCFDDENGQRVYKGEGTIHFTCYYPFAHTPIFMDTSKPIKQLTLQKNTTLTIPCGIIMNSTLTNKSGCKIAFRLFKIATGTVGNLHEVNVNQSTGYQNGPFLIESITLIPTGEPINWEGKLIIDGT